METQRERLIFARKEAGYRGFRTAAAALKINENTYKAHEQGRNNFDYDQAKIYGQRFGFEPLWLFSGEGPMRPEQPSSGLKLSPKTQNESDFVPVVQIPVLGEVAAGKWLEFDDLAEGRYAPILAIAGRYPVKDQFAFKVSGTSMDKARIFDGDLVICVPYWTARAAPTAGDLVVVERRKAGVFERTVKELAIQDGHYELWPRSSDPRFQQPITVPKKHDLIEADGTTVEIIGLVVASYVPRD